MIILESVTSLFPHLTQKEAESIISKFFNGVRDRHGGREERRKRSKSNALVEKSPVVASDPESIDDDDSYVQPKFRRQMTNDDSLAPNFV